MVLLMVARGNVCVFRDHIEGAGHVCVLRDTKEFSSDSEVSLRMSQERFDAALAIHLFKGGRLLLGALELYKLFKHICIHTHRETRVEQYS